MRRRRPSFWSLHAALGWAALSVYGCGLTLLDPSADVPADDGDLGASSGSPGAGGASSSGTPSSSGTNSSSGAHSGSSSSGEPGTGSSSGEPSTSSSSGEPGTGSSSGAPPVWPAENLLRNPGAEQCSAASTPDDWLGELGHCQSYGVSGAPSTSDTPDAAHAGQRFFMGTIGALRPNEDDGADGWLAQEVDLSPYAALLAAGTHYTLDAWIGGWSNDRDRAEVKVTFFRDDDELGASDVLTVTRDDRERKTRLIARTASGLVPVEATAARVHLQFKHRDGGDTDGYVDNVSLKLLPTPAP